MGRGGILVTQPHLITLLLPVSSLELSSHSGAIGPRDLGGQHGSSQCTAHQWTGVSLLPPKEHLPIAIIEKGEDGSTRIQGKVETSVPKDILSCC